METAFFIIAAFIFGLCMGSFLNVVAWRLPQGRTLLGRSACPKCNHTLTALDLVPVLSFLAFRGSCRHCGATISKRYIAIEIITGALYAFTAAYFIQHGFAATLPFVLTAIKYLVVISLAEVIFLIDLDYYLILDKIIFPSIAFFLIFNLVQDYTVLHAAGSPLAWHAFSLSLSGVAAAILYALPFYILHAISRGRWMGFGDVKYVLLMGLILGLSSGLIALLLAFFLGAIIGLALIIAKNKTLMTKVPLGTFLSIGLVVALFYGHDIFARYLQLIGF